MNLEKRMRKMTIEEHYMKEAIRQAKKAAALKEVPIGCVIVYDGRIIARGYNRRTVDKTYWPTRRSSRCGRPAAFSAIGD